MGHVLAVANSKGGVGKTTTAVNLAAGLAAIGRRVLLVDTDTQAQAGQALGADPPVGLAELVTGEAEPRAAIYEARPGLDLLAGGPELAALAREIARADYGGEATLARTLEPIAGGYDYVLIDTGPG